MTAAALAEPLSVQRSDRTTQTPHHRPRLGTRELDPEQVQKRAADSMLLAVTLKYLFQSYCPRILRYEGMQLFLQLL